MSNISHTMIIPYQSDWPKKFLVEKESLKKVFGGTALEIEHIGSTSIGGLSSKPIIDIVVMIENHENENSFTESLSQIGIAGIDKSIDPDKVIEVIDHRKVNDSAKFKNAKVQIELIGAAATLVAERFYNSKMEISDESATLLYGAVVSNTLNFQSPLTTDRDRKMAEWLNSKINLPDTFTIEMFMAKSDLSGERLSKAIRGDYSKFEAGGATICIAQLEMIGAKELIDSRKDHILAELAWLTKEHGFKFTFLSIVELKEGCNYFVTEDERAQNILVETMGLKFVDGVARRSGLIMQKQIIPIIKEALAAEKSSVLGK